MAKGYHFTSIGKGYTSNIKAAADANLHSVIGNTKLSGINELKNLSVGSIAGDIKSDLSHFSLSGSITEIKKLYNDAINELNIAAISKDISGAKKAVESVNGRDHINSIEEIETGVDGVDFGAAKAFVNDSFIMKGIEKNKGTASSALASAQGKIRKIKELLPKDYFSKLESSIPDIETLATTTDLGSIDIQSLATNMTNFDIDSILPDIGSMVSDL